MPAGLIPRILKKLLKGRMELFLDIESGIFRNRTGDENMNLCGVRLVRSRSFLWGRMISWPVRSLSMVCELSVIIGLRSRKVWE